ncbi:MAG: hypothetical protein E6J55_23830 [Deltaproteobacteria bacterium]|nr:MAG: hypothetical protein E6J55_23830 [Deltaproteobacteria bacterium]
MKRLRRSPLIEGSGTTDGRARGASRRSGAAGRRARPTVGALGPAPAALPTRLRPPALPHGAARLRACAPERVSPPGAAPGAPERRDRHGDERATLRRGGERSPPLSHARPRRRLRARVGRRAALPSGLATHGRRRAPRRRPGTAAPRAPRAFAGDVHRRGHRSARGRVGCTGEPLPGSDPRPDGTRRSRGAGSRAGRRRPGRAVGRAPRAAPRPGRRLRPPCRRARRRGGSRAARALCQYLCRPPLGQGGLHRLRDGRIAVALQRPWADGTTHVVFTPKELLERLVPLVPRPRINLVLYHGLCCAQHNPC